MIISRKIPKYIIIDICTQENLFLAKSNDCIKNHSRILSNIRRVMAWARDAGILVISICKVYSCNNFNYSFHEKIRYTKRNSPYVFPLTSSTDIPINILSLSKQIILFSRSDDPFEEPLIERLLSELKAKEIFVIGGLIEKSISFTVLGLLQRGKKTRIIIDAVGSQKLNSNGSLFLRKLNRKGASFVLTKQLVGTSHLREVGICNCSLCSNKLIKNPV